MCDEKRKNSLAELEKYVANWGLEQRQDGYIVTRAKIRAYALKWAKSNQEQSKEFKATIGWCSRFMYGNNLVIRQKPKNRSRLPRDLDHKVASFRQFITRLRQRPQFSLLCIGNMNETPLNFDMIGERMVDMKGVKIVLVKGTGHEKTRFTVVLSCMADGTKLKPMVIFKHKTKPQINFPSGIFVHFHERDENGVKLWINNVLNRRPGGIRKERSLLVWDMFRSHITENSKPDYHQLILTLL